MEDDPIVIAARKQVAQKLRAQRKSFKASLAVKLLTPKTRRRGCFKKFSLL